MRDLDLERTLELRLEVFASWGDSATFRNLAAAAGKNQLDRRTYKVIVEALRELDRSRHQQGLPLLSPIVRRSRTAKPPAGIASLLRELGLLEDGLPLEWAVEEQRQQTWKHYRPSARGKNRAADEAVEKIASMA